MSETPTSARIQQWITATYPAVANPTTWADYLEGLPWNYLKPVCQIAVNAHHRHPAIVLHTAAMASQDPKFKLVASDHITAKPDTPD